MLRRRVPGGASGASMVAAREFWFRAAGSSIGCGRDEDGELCEGRPGFVVDFGECNKSDVTEFLGHFEHELLG